MAERFPGLEEAGGSNPPNSTLNYNYTSLVADEEIPDVNQIMAEIDFMISQEEHTRALQKYLRFLTYHRDQARATKQYDELLLALAPLPTLIDRWGFLPDIRIFLVDVMDDINNLCSNEQFNQNCRMLLFFNAKINNKINMDKFEKLAIEYFLNERHLASDRCSILNHLGYHFSDQKRYREAEEVFKRCLEACDLYNLPSSVKYVPQLNLASVFYEQDKNDEAFRMLVALFRHHDFAYTNPHLVNIARIYLGKVELKRNNISKAIGHLIVARELASKSENFQDEILALEALVNLYKFLGDKIHMYKYIKDLVNVAKFANMNIDTYNEYLTKLKDLEPFVEETAEDRHMHEALYAIEFVEDFNNLT